MKIYRCQNIEYLFARQCELDSEGIIVPKSGFEFIELFSGEKITFKEKSKIKEGNISYKQTVDIETKYTEISEIQNLNDQHLILKVYNINGESFTWGSLLPYNPVQLELDTEGRVADISFVRIHHLPELP